MEHSCSATEVRHNQNTAHRSAMSRLPPSASSTGDAMLPLVASDELSLGIPHRNGPLPSAGAHVGVQPAPRLMITPRALGAAALFPLAHASQAAALHGRRGRGRGRGRGGAVQQRRGSCGGPESEPWGGAQSAVEAVAGSKGEWVCDQSCTSTRQRCTSQQFLRQNEGPSGEQQYTVL